MTDNLFAAQIIITNHFNELPVLPEIVYANRNFLNLVGCSLDDIMNENEPKMILRSKKKILPLIVFPIEGMHHLDVRDFLLKYLPEVEMHEPVSHKIMEVLGF